MGHVLFCNGCGENYWSANGHMQPGEKCRSCGGDLELDRRTDMAAPPTNDRGERPPVHALP